jgi:hypothetical protein
MENDTFERALMMLVGIFLLVISLALIAFGMYTITTTITALAFGTAVSVVLVGGLLFMSSVVLLNTAFVGLK